MQSDDGIAIEEITLGNAGGATASILNWGATVRDLVVPVAGKPRRVVLGYRDLEAYRTNPFYFGATAGRVANRTAGGRLVIDGSTHALPCNENGRVHLHGGPAGFSRRAWSIVDRQPDAVTLELVSDAGDQGYPGRVVARCRYELTVPATLRITMTATTDAPTAVSLAHHSYFTLGGDVREHLLQIFAPAYTPVDADKVPTGLVLPVAGTPFDFTHPRAIGASGEKYDHNFILAGADALTEAVRVVAPDQALAMSLRTTAPAVQFYDGHMVGAHAEPHAGQTHAPYAGFCLEPQHIPDALNHRHFRSSLLRPGETYQQITEYAFQAL